MYRDFAMLPHAIFSTWQDTQNPATMPTHRPMLALELAIHHAEKYFNFFSPSLHEKIKTPDTQADTTKTVELNKDNALQTQTTEGLLLTAVWRNGGCSASYDSFVVGSSAVLRLNFYANNPPLRQAAKRWLQA